MLPHPPLSSPPVAVAAMINCLDIGELANAEGA